MNRVALEIACHRCKNSMSKDDNFVLCVGGLAIMNVVGKLLLKI